MPVEAKRRLCDALLRIESMADQSVRNLYISELERQLGECLSFSRYPDPTLDVWSLINACMTRPEGLRQFTRIVRTFHGNHHAMAVVERLVADLEREPALTLDEREALLRLLARVPIHQIRAASEVLPDWPDRPPLDSDDMRSFVEQVASLNDPAGGPPALLRFADALAHVSEDGVSHDLHQWTDALGRRLDLDPVAVRALCAWSREALSGRRQPAPASTVDFGETPLPDAPAEPPGESMWTAPVIPRTAYQPLNLPRIWGGVPFRNPNFTGRDGLLERLCNELAHRSKSSVFPQTLHGFGGVGKTQLAVEYVYRYADRYNLVWWISADRPTGVLASLASLGERLELPISQDKQQNARTVLDALGTSPYQWLLVYDNADRPDDISPLVPSAGGHVILTSRNVDWTRKWNTVEVDVFDRLESVELLAKRDTGISAEAADSLADKLGDLPLALEQAVNFQLATGMPTDEYLQLFDERVRDLLSEGKPSDYPTTVAAFLTLAFDSLRDAAPAAAELLELFAYLGPEPISAGLLRSGRAANLSSRLAASLRDPIQMNRIIRDLPRYGLARVEPKGQQIQVHRLVQAVLRTELSEQRRTQSRRNVWNLLGAASPSNPDDQETWRVHAELGPHVLPADLIHATNSDARLVALDQSRYLFQNGDYAGSRALGEAMVEAWSNPPGEDGLGPDHEQTLLAYRHLANALRMMGDYGEARRLDERAFEFLHANPNFGNDHEHTVGVAFGLGFDLSMAGDLAGSLDRDQENLARATRVYGLTDDYTLQAKGNVAADLRQLGRFREAYELSRSRAEECQETLGDSDARTLWAISELVRDVCGLGRYREALDMQNRVWDLYGQFLKPHQREFLLAERNIAIALRKAGDHTGALNLSRDNYQAFRTRFGAHHEYTLASAMTYTNALRAAGRLTEARDAGAPAVDGYLKKFGERHRLSLFAQVNQGIVLRLHGERRAALTMENRAAQGLSEVLGAAHPYTLCAANNYANSLLLDHRVSEARQLIGQTLNISRRVRGTGHPDTLACEINAALDLQSDAPDAAPQQHLDQVLDTFGRVLGRDHPSTVDAIRGKRADCDIEPPPT
ncbi:MAG: tetratricopeptide repeat protein [Dactylosporangium sp.]|nr:tetratricopeptide repeat protein [Dactylosporangium sp.]NNJ60149.1 tetratricopeptide repeat protein [Dactylosporangium sp.]